jgi:hypothetical protein
MTFVAKAYVNDEIKFAVTTANSKDEATEKIAEELDISKVAIVWMRSLHSEDVLVFQD